MQRAVRDEQFKLVEYSVKGARTTQLFDLRVDPLERHTLADEPAHAAQLSRLRAALEDWRKRLDDHGHDLADPARRDECFWAADEWT